MAAQEVLDGYNAKDRWLEPGRAFEELSKIQWTKISNVDDYIEIIWGFLDEFVDAYDHKSPKFNAISWEQTERLLKEILALSINGERILLDRLRYNR